MSLYCWNTFCFLCVTNKGNVAWLKVRPGPIAVGPRELVTIPHVGVTGER